eukprot:m.360780 g.360780  ORF g.360780 m.360780 type:complete len:311 (-) comp19164_c0_seq1:256-1188(-)
MAPSTASDINIVSRVADYLTQDFIVLGDLDQIVSPNTFKWEYNKTPFTNLWFLVASVVAYVAFSFFLQAMMKGRDRCSGKFFTYCVVAHNIVLSGGSLIMCLGGIYEVALILFQTYNGSMVDTMCDTNNTKLSSHPRLAWWLYIFYLSKFYEMIDTYVLALKKKPLTFLQMYHHGIVAFLVWTWMEADWLLAWLGLIANTLVHTFMYYYFGCQALGIKIWWKKYITTGQLVQFGSVFILMTLFMVYGWEELQFMSTFPFVYPKEEKCHSESWTLIFSQIINTSFLYLFGDLFVRLYLSKPAAQKDDKKSN